MKELKREHKIFINEYLIDGDKKRAYKVAYPNCTDLTALSNSLRLLQKSYISERIKEETARIEQDAYNQLVQDEKDKRQYKILTTLQKRELLYQIAFGEIEIEMKKVVFDPIQKKFDTVTIIGKPDFSERLKALDMDNKMSGAYPPVGVQTSWDANAPIQHEHKHVVIFENYRE